MTIKTRFPTQSEIFLANPGPHMHEHFGFATIHELFDNRVSQPHYWCHWQQLSADVLRI
jgi:hypothetical protein